MASSINSPFTPLFSPTTNLRRITTIRCGPRDSRGPLVKGRILSTEAIHAVQSLKRAHRTDPTATLPTATLTRLLKPDLTAALKELLRQDQCELAARVFSAVRSEFGSDDLDVYADLVAAMARNGMAAEIDKVIEGIEEGGGVIGGSRGVLRLVKAVIAAGRRESTVRIYGMMKRSSGWGEMDEYLGRCLSKGLRRVGEGVLADEVDLELRRLYRGVFVNSSRV